MASTINADDGVISGIAGVKTTADSTGALNIQTNGTTAISISAAQAVSLTNSPTFTGGTANGVLFLNASKVATSGTALVFDGTNLGVGGAPTNYAGYKTITLDGGTTGAEFDFKTNGTLSGYLESTSSLMKFHIPTSSNFVWNINSEQMRLNSTGLGIGTTSPGTKLEVYVTRTSATNAVAINLNDNVTGIQTDGVYKAIRSLSNGNASVSEIRFLETGGTNNDTSIAFATQSTAGALTERMRINQVGNLGLGVTLSTWTSTAHIGRVFQTGGAAYFGRTDNADGYFSSNVYRDTSDWKYYTNNGAAMIQQSGGTIYIYGADSGTANNAVTWTQIFQISKGNSLALQGATYQSGAGITFPASQSASTNANTLDDYEEGTFDPTFTCDTTAPTGVAYTSRSGRYTKIGRVVYIQVAIALSNKGTGGTGFAVIGNLPFTTASDNPYANFGAMIDVLASDLRQVSVQSYPNQPFAYLIKNGGSTGGHDGMAFADITSSTQIRVGFFYIV